MDSNNNAEIEKEQELSLHSDACTTSTKSESSSSLNSSQNSYDSQESTNENNSGIKEVYASNLKKELKTITWKFSIHSNIYIFIFVNY